MQGNRAKQLTKRGQLLVAYGPWVPKPVQPPLAIKPTISEIIVERIMRAEQSVRLPRICAAIRAAADAERARDEILGL